ncbi:MAG: paraquat-inducible protein A [Epsilonproteobacteria bacterium]|nr:paraquat-inducible protein A [Campylobacterota bacterium]
MKKSELDNLVICKKCHTLHRKIPLHHHTKALCRYCDTVIYRNHHNLLNTTLALSITALVLLIVAFSFTIISININGIYQSLDLNSLFIVIFEHQYYLVGIMLSFLIVLFPLMILGSTILLLFLMKLKSSPRLVRQLLILIAKLIPWSMVDIFFISILVAMVKLFDYAQIDLGVAFVAFILVLLLDLVLIKRLSFNELWMNYEETYRGYNANKR